MLADGGSSLLETLPSLGQGGCTPRHQFHNCWQWGCHQSLEWSILHTIVHLFLVLKAWRGIGERQWLSQLEHQWQWAAGRRPLWLLVCEVARLLSQLFIVRWDEFFGLSFLEGTWASSSYIPLRLLTAYIASFT